MSDETESQSRELALRDLVAGALAGRPLDAGDVVAAFLAGRSPETLRAYDADLRDYARFLGLTDPKTAVSALLAAGHGNANLMVLSYRAWLADRGMSTATQGRRLAALRSVVRLARSLGRVNWSLDVPSPKQEKYRDTRGPGTDGWRRIRETAAARSQLGDPRAVRDLAIVATIRGLALRRNELVELDLADVELDPPNPGLWIRGKGKTEKIRLSLSAGPAQALRDWIAARGTWEGPLFVRMDRGAVGYLHDQPRLSGRAVGDLVPALAHRAGLTRRVRPHGLRHEAITTALDRTGGDVRKVQRFSRHADLRTLSLYDDRRSDGAGDVANLIDGDL